MRLLYISPSVMPSRSANAVHVAHQCEAFARLGIRVTLIVKRGLPNKNETYKTIRQTYGVMFKQVRIVSFFNRITLAENLQICMLGLIYRLTHPRLDVIVSRNLYASFCLALLSHRPLVFETHQLEYGFRGYLQRIAMTRPWVRTVVISQVMLELLTQHHGRAPSRVIVLHDAAPEGIRPLPPEEKHPAFRHLFSGFDPAGYRAVCGYFGHLYPGRGIEIIEQLACRHPDVGFAVIGGNDSVIARYRDTRKSPNLHFLGHVPHLTAQTAMAACDALLMPYQQKVSIGVRDHDTARWMSPMKMFEYMASGVPLISSDLSPLREVLVDGDNALLVPATDVDAWSQALIRLINDPAFAARIGSSAHACYAARHTWTQRAQAMLEAVTG